MISRRGGRMMLLVVLAAICLPYGKRYVSKCRAWLDESRTSPRREQATAQHTYILDQDGGWLEFNIPAQGRMLRVLSNATFTRPLPVADSSLIRPGWRYVLQYEILNQRRDILTQKHYHFRSQITHYESPDTGELFTSAFFEDQTRVPAATRRVRIPLKELQGTPTFLRLRISETQSEIADIGVRVSCEGLRPEFDDPHVWQRLSKPRRDKLAMASIYPEELLTHLQRQSLLKFRRSFLAPIGVEGRDYLRRLMYLNDQIRGQEVNDDVVPAGLPINHRLRGSFRLPTQPGVLRLEFCSRGGQHFDNRIDVEASWFGDGPFDRKAYKWKLDESKHGPKIEVNGGLLEIRSPVELFVRLFWRAASDETDEQEITPAPRLSRMFPTRLAGGLTFKVSHIGDLPTPYRISLRQTNVADQLTPQTVRCELIDESGDVCETHQLIAAAAPSQYDHVPDRSGAESVTDADQYVLEVPRDVKAIRLQSESEAVYASLSSRVPDVPQRREVPAPVTDGSRVQRNWFPLRPQRYREMMELQQAVIVRFQPRPPQISPDLVEGDYSWESFSPADSWKGRFLLIPRPGDAPNRVQAARVTFLQLDPQLEYSASIPAFQHGAPIPLQVLYWLGKPAPKNTTDFVRIFADGRLLAERRLAANTGEIVLPEIGADLLASFLLRVEAPDTAQVFIRGVEIADRPSYLKRLAPRWDTCETVYEYERSSEERTLLVLDYFSSNIAVEDIEVQIQTNGMASSRSSRPYRDWTANQRLFELRPHATPLSRCIVMGAKHQSEVHRYRCLIPLGDNLGVGKYRIHVRRATAHPAYTVLSKTTLGIEPTRTFSRQRETDGMAPTN